MIRLSVNAKKELNRGANQILGDGRIVIGIERDNHKEIENCQNQKKDEEIKVVDYSQFEASTKSGIHAVVNRIRQKDEIIRAVVKKRRNSAITCVCFVCMAGISLLKGWIPALICILIALFFLWRAVGKFSDEYLRELYEEGLLVPGMIVKTEPLTIMAIANMVAKEGAAAVNGCYCLEVKVLDGAREELFEKIPCLHGDPLAQDLMHRFAQGAVQVRFAAQDQRKAVDGIITVIHEHLDVLKNTSGKVLCLIYGQRRLFLFMIEAEDLLLYGAEHSQLSAPALHAQDSAELAVKLHDAHSGKTDIFHVVQAGVKAFCKAVQTE